MVRRRFGLRVAAWIAIVIGSLGLARPAAAGQDAAAPTFTKDVAPIFQEKCQACHRAGYIAPMSLVTYEEVRPWVRSIKGRIAARQMPPWHIDRTVGIQKFKNDRSLTDAELDTVVRWIDAGAPKGDPNDLPPAKEFARDDVWNLTELFGGPPDLVIKSTPYTMPALAQDHWWKPEVPTGLAEDRWIRGIEIRPSTVPGRKITHHALARLQQEETDPLALGAASDVGPGLLMEWAVGKQGEIMRPNSGKLIKAGSSIVWDIHYHAVGEADHRHRGARPLLLPEGTGAEVPPGAGEFQRDPGRQPQPRDPAELGRRHRELPRDAAERAHRELPAAPAPPRQGHEHGGDSAGRLEADAERRHRLRLQLAQQLRLRGRCRPARPEGDRPASSRRGSTTRLRNGEIRIRISGSAGATGPSTRWDMRG